MLNPYLNLNKNLFGKVEEEPTRDGFGRALITLGDKDPNVVVLTADLSESTRTNEFAKKYPDRFFDVGVAEQNMATIAAGFGISGKTAFISSYAVFSPGRNWEQLRTTVIYNNSNVKIAGHHSGIVTGPDGSTHQATEDIAIVRSWPGIRVIVPCDSIEAEKAILAEGSHYGPAYIRFTRDKTPIITTKDTPFEIGKAQVFWIMEGAQATILATGHMLYTALLAAKKLEAEGIPTLVVNVSTIKPLDEKTILDVAAQTGAFVSVEDHQIMGGLGGALAELLAKNNPIPMEFVGLQDTFAESGSPKELMEKYHMDEKAVIDAVKKVISRK